MNHGLLRQFRRYPSFFTSCAFHVLLVMRQWVSSHCRPRPTKREFLRRCLDFPPKVRINVSSPGNGSVYSATLKPSTLSARSISGTFVLKLWRHGGHGEPSSLVAAHGRAKVIHSAESPRDSVATQPARGRAWPGS